MTYGGSRPWPGGYAGYGVVAWRPDGIWFVSEFGGPCTLQKASDTWGLYHLDPVSGDVTHAQRYEQIVTGGTLLGGDVYGHGFTADGGYVRVTPDGAAHVLPGMHPSVAAIAAG